jgi:hypothetical protein
MPAALKPACSQGRVTQGLFCVGLQTGLLCWCLVEIPLFQVHSDILAAPRDLGAVASAKCQCGCLIGSAELPCWYAWLAREQGGRSDTIRGTPALALAEAR